MTRECLESGSASHSKMVSWSASTEITISLFKNVRAAWSKRFGRMRPMNIGFLTADDHSPSFSCWSAHKLVTMSSSYLGPD